MKGKMIRRLTATALAVLMVGTAVPDGSLFKGVFGGNTAYADTINSVTVTEYGYDTATDTLTSTDKVFNNLTVVMPELIQNTEEGAGLTSCNLIVTGDTTIDDYVYIRKGCTVNLVVNEGVTLTCSKGIGCGLATDGTYATLNIYGKGKIVSKGAAKVAGIGGKKDESNGIINIHGTTIEATGGKHGAGIGGGEDTKDATDSNTIKIYNADITAKGGIDGAGIGGGDNQIGAKTYIYRSTIVASSEKHGA